MAHWGIIGLGRIAQSFIDSLLESENDKIYAVSSISEKNLETFQEKHPDIKVCSNYKELIDDPQIDAVYISLIGESHIQYTLYALEHHVPVICKAPSTTNVEVFEQIIETSEKNRTIYLEGLRTRFLPSYRQLVLDTMNIGDILSIYCNVNDTNVTEDTYALPVGFATKIIQSTMMNVDLNSNDSNDMVTISFRSGAKLEIERTTLPLLSCKIIGTKGTIILSNYAFPKDYSIFIGGTVIDRKFDIQNDIDSTIEALDYCRDKGLMEHPEMTFSDTKQIIEIVAAIIRELENDR